MLFQKNVPLAQYSNFRIGGPAKYFFEAQTIEHLQAAMKEAARLNEPIFILGGGNNLLISDKGFDGVVIHPAFRAIEVDAGAVVRVGAGLMVSEMLDFCLDHELLGFEWAGGLPSTVGGAIWGNAGAFGGETKDRVRMIRSVGIDGVVKERSAADCKFGYRTSVFKTEAQQEVIVEASFQLEKGSRAALHEAIEHKKQYRRDRQPLEYPNIGSIFKNVPVERIPRSVGEAFSSKIKQDPFPVLPTAVLIAAAGLKEYRVGGAMVSPKHSNFIVNVGGATAADVRAVMAHVRSTVNKKFGVDLEQEVIFVGQME